jgi:predicted DNA-binding transcriptional regulator YafY
VATDRRWYLVAFDLEREDWRTFRVDRISQVKVPGHTFVPRPLSDPAKMVAEGISIAHYRHTAVVEVKAPLAEVGLVIAPHVGVLSEEGTGTTLVELGIDDFEWLAGYLIGLGLDFEVREPAALRVYMATLGARLSAAHGS